MQNSPASLPVESATAAAFSTAFDDAGHCLVPPVDAPWNVGSQQVCDILAGISTKPALADRENPPNPRAEGGSRSISDRQNELYSAEAGDLKNGSRASIVIQRLPDWIIPGCFAEVSA
jgi:hypothetical protein